jgi:tRNA A-37 threonylcarbamoyl transferase component Bud32
VPLGESELASVFLVRGGSPWHSLLRMKRWRTQAPSGFVEAFDRLKWQLEAWRQPAIVMPATAWIDAAGFSVLTEFRQGVPLLDAVNSGRLSADAAAAALRRLRDVIGEAHARGLAHGSIVSGNVFVGPPDSTPYLLDFGFGVLLGSSSAGDAWVESDLHGFARLEAALQAFTAKSDRL